MIKLVYGVGVLSLVLAGVPCVFCGMRWRQVAGWDRDAPPVAAAAKAPAANRAGSRGNGMAVTPLVAQATAFALYLNPPKPPAPAQAPPRVSPPQPAPKPVVVAPKFRLLSTSCHALHPEKSLALISEPGRGDRWIRKGDHLGHLVVESIRDGTLVYREGGQLHEVTVATKPMVELARVTPAPATATQITGPDVRLVNAAGTKESDRPAVSDGPAEYERQ